MLFLARAVRSTNLSRSFSYPSARSAFSTSSFIMAPKHHKAVVIGSGPAGIKKYSYILAFFFL